MKYHVLHIFRTPTYPLWSIFLDVIHAWDDNVASTCIFPLEFYMAIIVSLFSFLSFPSVKGKLWSDWSDWSPCVEHWSGKCKRLKQRYCFNENKKKCKGADDYGVQSIEEECKKAQCLGM